MGAPKLFPQYNIYDKCPVYLIFWIINLITSSFEIELRYMYCKLIANIAHSSMHSYIKSGAHATEKAKVYKGGNNWGYTGSLQTYWEGIFGKDKFSELGNGLRPIRMCGGDTIDTVFKERSKELSFKQTKEFWDDIMQKCLPNIIAGDLHGFSIGTYAQFDVHIRMNCLPVAWHMFGNALKKVKNFSYFSDWVDALVFVNSEYTKPLRFATATMIQKTRTRGVGLNTLGQVYSNFEMVTFWLNLSAVNWDQLNKNSVKAQELNEKGSKYTNADGTSNSVKNQTVFLQATNAKSGIPSELSNIITNFSKNISDSDFVDKYVNENSPFGFFYKNIGKNIEQLSTNLKKIGARDKDNQNKYKFECMFQFNLFSYPPQLISNLINQDAVFPTGSTGSLYKSMNCITNMNYLKDFEPKHPLITPGYTDEPIRIVPLITPSWTGVDKSFALNYPIRYYTRDFYLNTKEMGEHMIKYQGNLYEPNGWTLQGVINNIKRDVDKSIKSNIRYFTKNGEMEHVTDQEYSASQEVLDILISVSQVNDTNDKFITTRAPPVVSASAENRGWYQYFTENRLAEDPDGIRSFSGDIRGKLRKVFKTEKWGKWRDKRYGRVKVDPEQNNTGLEKQDPDKSNPSEDTQTPEEAKDNAKEFTKEDGAKTGENGTTSIEGQGSPQANPQPIDQVKSPNTDQTNQPRSEGEPEANVGSGPDKGLLDESLAEGGAEAGEATGSLLEAAGLALETLASVAAFAGEIAMAVAMVVAVVAQTKRMWDDLCQHADTYFQSQLNAKQLAIDMEHLLENDDGSGDCQMNINYIPPIKDNKVNPAFKSPENDKGTNCLQCGVNNSTKSGCTGYPDFSGACTDPHVDGTSSAATGSVPCSSCQPGDSGQFNCVPDDLCIPDKNGIQLFPCRCHIFTQLSQSRDALIKAEMFNNIVVNSTIEQIQERNKKFTIILAVIVILIFIALLTKYLFATRQTTFN